MANITVGHHERAPGRHEFKWGRASLGLAVVAALFGAFEVGQNTTRSGGVTGRAEATEPVTPIRETQTAPTPTFDYSASRVAQAETGFAELDRLAAKYHTSPSIIAQFKQECRALGDRRPLEECIVDRMQSR